MFGRCFSIAVLCATLVHLGTLDARAVNVLMVTKNNGSLTTQESYRQSQFQAWGYTVNTIWDGAPQATYDAAFAVNDVVYVCEEMNANDVQYKLRNAPIGVVNEDRPLTQELGISANNASSTSTTRIYVTDNSHPITQSFSTGWLYIASSSIPATYLGGSTAPGGVALATINGHPALFVIEGGGELVNTHDGNSTAAGRRVQLPFGANNFDFRDLDSDGLTLVENAIIWSLEGSAPALVGHWKLDETSGTTAVDSSGRDHDGTVVGTANWTSGQVGGSLQLDGNTRVEIPTLLNSPPNVTIAAWVNLTARDSSGAEVVSIGDCFAMRLDNTTTTSYAFFYNGSGWTTLSINQKFAGEGWHHVAVVFDDEHNTFKIYVDGQQAASASTSQSIVYTGLGDSIVIGAHGNGQTAYDFVGRIDDVRVYNYALSAAEIAEVYGLVGHWKLDETSGTIAHDSSGLGNHGTVVGAATWTGGQVDGDGDGHPEGAIGLDGSGYVEIPYDERFDSQTYTVSAWVYCTEISYGFESGILGTRSNGVEYGFDVKVDPGVIHGDIPAVGTSWLDTAVDIRGTDTGSNGQGGGLALNHWYLVTYVVDGTSNTANLYLDGDLKRTISLSATPRFIRPGQTLMIGNSATAYNEYFYGTIDDVRLYNRVLGAEEIQQLYGSSTPAGVRIIKWVEIQ